MLTDVNAETTFFGVKLCRFVHEFSRCYEIIQQLSAYVEQHPSTPYPDIDLLPFCSMDIYVKPGEVSVNTS